jgi:hypothetical protein
VIPAALAAPVTTLAVVVTQNQPPAPGADRGEEFGSSSPIALVVILLLGIATAFLIRSMNKRLRNVPRSFDAEGEPAEGEDGDGATATSGEESTPTAPQGGSAGKERTPPDG